MLWATTQRAQQIGAKMSFVGEVETANRLRGAVLACLAAGQKTADIGGKLGTREFTQAVIERFEAS